MTLGGILVQTSLIDQLRDIRIIGWMTLFFGILLYFSDKFTMNKNIKNDFNIKTALIIGFFQKSSC